MAYKQVLFEDNMETQAGDFNNMQTFINDSMNYLVGDAIDPAAAYVGLTITKAANTQVRIDVGRLYWQGKQYSLDDPVIIDFQTVAGAMPVTQQRQIAIVAYGQTINSDTEPRNFVVDADTGQAQSESVSMLLEQVCLIGPIPGVEAPSPSYPAVPATNLLVGFVLMAPSGVVSIQQNIDTLLPNLMNHEIRIQALEAEFGLAENQIATLQTALAALAAQLKNFVTWDAFNKLVDLVNWCVQNIQKLLQAPPVFVTDTQDNFFDTSQSAVGTTLDGLPYNAFISEGIRFPTGGTATVPMVLFNSNEPTIQAWDTFILPQPSGMRVRMDCSFPNDTWIVEPIQNHAFWTYTARRLGWARFRARCGIPWTPVNNTISTKQSNVDPVTVNLMFDTESWTQVLNSTTIVHDDDDPDWPRWLGDRFTYYWRDFCDRDYWGKTFTNFPYANNIVGQSFLNAQDGWLGGITVFSMLPNYLQPLNLLIQECDVHGKPLHNRTIGKIELDINSIVPCYGIPVRAGDIIGTTIVTSPIYSTTTTVTPGVDYGFDTRGQPPNTGPLGTQTFGGYQGVEPFRGGVQSPTTTTTTSITGYQNTPIYTDIPVYAYPVRINFSPVFLASGKRYAFHLASAAAHQFAVSTNPACYQVHQGDCWEYDTSSDFRVVPGGPRTLRFLLHYLTWGNWQGQAGQVQGQLRYPVTLQPLQLGGTGISSIDVLSDAIIPPTTDLSYAVSIGGGAYKVFNYDPNAPSFPPGTTIMGFQVTFTGTSDLMPGLSLVNSQVKLMSQPVNAFWHISTNIPTGGATTAAGVKVMVNVTNWTSHHTLDCKLHTGASQVVKTGVAGPILLPDGVTNQFTYTFTTGASGITNYQVELQGGTDGTGNSFVVHQRTSFHG